MNSTLLFVAIVVAMILYTVGNRLYRFYLFRKRVNKIPGSTYAIPFLGIMYDVMMKPKEDRLEWFKGMIDQYKDGLFRISIGSTANVNIHKPEHVEKLKADMNLTLLIVAIIVAMIFYTIGGRLYRFYLFRQRVNKIPGPDFSIPLFGVAYELMKLPKKDHTKWFRNIGDQYHDAFFLMWVGFHPTVYIRKPEHLEIILRSNSQITKSEIYDFLSPWLGRGLLTSTGAHWFHSRKFITPAFHFNILEGFVDVMINKATIFNSCIEREIKIHGDKPFDIFPMAERCALDIICETAMGTNIHAQEGIENEYIKAVKSITTDAVNRYNRPWLWADWIFYNTAAGKSYKAAIDMAQDYCTQIILRKQEERKSGVTVSDVSSENEVTGKCKTKALLDLMLEANDNEDNPLTIEEIRDQINTFMFAGHDTTGGLVGWTLFCIGNDLNMQRKLHDELDNILDDSDHVTTIKKLPSLKYLERVIKEALRLYPSVGVISRTLTDDTKIGDYTVPAGVTVSMQIYELHRDPAVWPHPLRFDPDRFLPENIKGRHPYAYVPFSAGPRNCIGQKFAMLEAKVILAQVLKEFNVKSIENHSTINKHNNVTLSPLNGVYVNMSKRSSIVDKLM